MPKILVRIMNTLILPHTHLYPMHGESTLTADNVSAHAQEADTRLWRHAVQCISECILIYSPDTDVYNIVLSLLQETPKQYIVQLNLRHSTQLRYIHLNHLQEK